MRQLQTIEIHRIKTNPMQPRMDFQDNAIMDLAQSIRENGLIQPISVRSIGNNEYEIIAGERRYRACKLNGATEIEAMILDVDDLQMAEMALVENVQREDLSAIEEAKAYVEIMRISSITQSELALKIGKSQSSIANKIRLLNLDNNIQNAVSKKIITERHARAMIGSSVQKQQTVLDKIIKKGLNVAQTEILISDDDKNKHEEKPLIKGVNRNVRIAINTIKQAVKMAEKVGSSIVCAEEENEDEVRLIIKIKK